MSEPKRAKTNRPTFRREDRDEFRTILAIMIARLLSLVVILIPSPFRDYIATRTAMISYRMAHESRLKVEANVRAVMGPEASDDEVAATTRSIFRTNGLNFSDLLTLRWRSDGWLGRRLHFTKADWNYIDTIRAEGNGVILVSGHLGCFDFIGHTFQAHGYPLTIVTGRTTSRFVFDGVTWLRGSRGAHMVEPTPSGVRHVIRALRKNEIAVLVADRDFFENGHPVVLFGQETTLPPGAVRIARDTGAPIVPVFAKRTAKGHEVEILPAIRVKRTKDVKADVEAGMQQLTPVLEQAIRARINQWAMLQRVWPDTPPQSIRIFPTGSPLESPLLEKVAQALPEISRDEPQAPTHT